MRHATQEQIDAVESLKGWNDFSKDLDKTPKYTKEEFCAKLKEAGIKTTTEYRKWCKHQNDERLPANPYKTYGCSWSKLSGYASKHSIKKYTKNEFCAMLKKHEITTSREYIKWYRRENDPRLPSEPRATYGCSWSELTTGHALSLRKFTKKYTKTNFLAKLKEYNIKSFSEYQKWCKKDSRLPSEPAQHYGCSWSELVTGQASRRSVKKYTKEEFCAKLQEYGIKKISEYREWFKKDSHLPSMPTQYYGCSWPGLAPSQAPRFPTKDEFCAMLEEHKIKKMKKYREWYKNQNDTRFPSNPWLVYGCSWSELTTGQASKRSITKYTKDECCAKLKEHGIKTFKEYQKWHKHENDPRLPFQPAQVYGCLWTELVALSCRNADTTDDPL